MIGLRYALGSDTGHVRSGNEDAAYAGPHLVAVADGMGGHAAGEVASRAVIDVISRLDADVPGSDLLSALQGAVDEAQAHLADLVAADPALRGMGTTLTALLVCEARLGLVHVGDSRAYLLREGQLAQITHDHTLVQELVDAGEITAEQATTHPRRSLLLRALDGVNPVEADLRLREARIGDRYLLCSDGLSGVITSPTMSEALTVGDPQTAADRLVDLALRAGGPDNITVAVVDVVEVAAEESGVSPIVAGAALLGSARARRRARRDVVDEPTATPGGRRRLRPSLVVPLLLVVLLAGGLLGVRTWLHHQWYVGVDGSRVTVFQGVPGSVAGIDLQNAREEVGDTSAVSEGDRGRLEDGITATGHADALRIARGLLPATPQPAAPTNPTPAPAPANPTPVPATSPAASP